jgi:Tol biopolymer transport system component
VEAVVLKALERLPADRFETAAELAAALKDKAFRHGVGVGAGAGPWKGLAISFGVVALLAIVVAVFSILAPEPPPPEVFRQRIHPPGDGPVTQWARYFALAPDGSSMVYRDTVGLESGYQLWVKDRESAEGRPLSGTTNARDVVYSPDGQWIAYTIGTDFIKRPLQGSGTVTLLEGMDNGTVGTSWMADSTILCEQEGNTLVRISQEGGPPPDTVFSFSSDLLMRVRGLPGEDAALAVVCPDGSCPRGSVLYAVDLQADTAWMVQDEVLDAWYVTTGHVVWVRRDGAVFATPFDLDRLEMGDNDQHLFEGVRVSSTTADMEMGKDGTAIFLQGNATSDDWEPVWVDRAGREETMESGLSGDLSSPALSPDGELLAVDVGVEGFSEIWISDLRRGSIDQLTVERLGRYPSWTPDGSSVTFCSFPAGNEDVWIRRADGTTDAELLIDYDRDLAEAVWSADGTWLIARTVNRGDTVGDILGWRMGTDAEPVPLVDTEFTEVTPALSPNGRFLAYTSNRLGLYQVYVQPFPNVEDGRWPISVETGIEPVWSRDGRELFYRRGATGDLVAVEVETEGNFAIGEERVLFPAGRYRAFTSHPQYDVERDGQRFVMLRPVGMPEEIPDPPMIQIQNFFTELQRRVGSEGGG